MILWKISTEKSPSTKKSCHDFEKIGVFSQTLIKDTEIFNLYFSFLPHTALTRHKFINLYLQHS